MLDSIEQLLLFNHLPGVGTATYWKIHDHFPSLNAAFSAPPSRLAALLPPDAQEVLRDYRTKGSDSAIFQRVHRDLDWAADHNIHIIDNNHEHYPQLLREVKKAPPLLYIAGDPGVLNFPQVAIVGTRNPSPAGRGIAQDFAAELARAGFAITSGLALGVDTCAHRGAVSVNGRTVAVLGTGIDNIYPQRNSPLAREIVANGGAIISEFPLGTSPIGHNFPQRNRIISGLSYGVLVVEAAVKSGSLITARYAVQQDRELFAVPGSIHNPLSRGCHALIKDGAKLVETAGDIVDELKGFLALKWEQLNLNKPADTTDLVAEIVANDQEEVVLSQLGYEATPIDQLVERTHLSVGEIMACLLALELRGLVANLGNGYMRIGAPKQPADLSFSQK